MKKKLFAVIALAFILTAVTVTACGKDKADFTIVPETDRIDAVELGQDFVIPAVKVFNLKDADVTEDAVILVTVTDPDGDELYVDENKVSPVKLGTHTIVYTLYGREDITKTLTFETKDTTAPQIVSLQNFESDVFAGDKCYLPIIAATDFSGVKSKDIKVYYKDSDEQPEVVGEGSGRYFTATSLDGYTLEITVTDEAGNSGVEKYDIRVTEKWTPATDEAAGLVDYQLATFDRDEYIDNVKAYGEGPTCDFELKTTDIPAADSVTGYGSTDGKVLSLTPAETRERCYVRIWLPRPIRRADFGSMLFKVYANEGIEKIWLQNDRNGEPEGGWDGAESEAEGSFVFNRWSVLEVAQYRFWEKKYAEDDLIEYLDIAVWYSVNPEIDPILYIDEIFTDTADIQFVDTELAENVIMDFDEYNKGGDGTGAGVENRKYESTIKVVSGENKGNLRYNRAFLSADDPEVTEGITGSASGGVLKLRPVVSETEGFLMFPTEVQYDPSYMVSIKLMVKKAAAPVNIRGYKDTNAYHRITFSEDKLNVWYEELFPMSVFAQDVTAGDNTLKGFLFYIAGVAGTDQTVYIDEIKLVEPIKHTVTDFKDGSEFEVIPEQTANNKLSAQFVSGSEAGLYNDGALKITYDPARFPNAAQAGATVTFAQPIPNTDLANLKLDIATDGQINFMRMFLMSGGVKGELLTGCNAGWGVVPAGYMTLSATTDAQLLKDSAQEITGLYIEVYPGETRIVDDTTDPVTTERVPVNVYLDALRKNEQSSVRTVTIDFDDENEYTARENDKLTVEKLTGDGEGYTNGALKVTYTEDTSVTIDFAEPLTKADLQQLRIYIKTSAQLNFLQGYLLFGDGDAAGDNMDPIIKWAPTQAGEFILKADNDARLGIIGEPESVGTVDALTLRICPGGAPVECIIDKIEYDMPFTGSEVVTEFGEDSAELTEPDTISCEQTAEGYKITYEEMGEAMMQNVDILFNEATDPDEIVAFGVTLNYGNRTTYLNAYLLLDEGNGEYSVCDYSINGGGWGVIKDTTVTLTATTDLELGRQHGKNIVGIRLVTQANNDEEGKTNTTITLTNAFYGVMAE